jgi:hypothetical protein
VSFVNNTVASNKAAAGTPAGVICSSSSYVLKNSILSGNGATQYGLCTFDHSNISSPPPGSLPPGATGDDCGLVLFQPAKGSKCTNAGLGTGISELDLPGTLRVKSSPVDLGAYEVE